MKKADFMQQPLTLAQLSQQYVKRLWKIEVEVSKSYAQVVFIFSSIFHSLINAVAREVGFSSVIPQLFLPRLTLIPHYDIDTGTLIPFDQEYLPSEETIGPNVSFLFNINVARKITTELARRVTPQIPKPVISLTPMFAHVRATEETIEEPAKTAFQVIADLQNQFTSKLAPSIMGIASTIQEKKIWPTPLVAVPKPLSVSPAKSQVGLPERLKAESSKTPSLPHEKTEVEAYTPFSMPSMRLGSEAVKSFEYATALPNVLFQQKIPILNAAATQPTQRKSFEVASPEKPFVDFQVSSIKHEEARVEIPTAKQEKEVQLPISANVQSLSSDAARSLDYAVKFTNIVLENEVPIIRTLAAFPSVSTPSSHALTIEHYYSPTSTAIPMTPTQTTHLPEEPALPSTSWIYKISQTLGDTQLTLSAIPLAVSNAQRVVREALMQPISSSKTPYTSGGHQSSSPNFETSGEVGEENAGVEAYTLPFLVSSQIAAQSQKYPLFNEPQITQTYVTSPEPTQFTSQKTTGPSKMPEVKEPSRLATPIAQAAAESLIAQKLQLAFTGLVTEMPILQSSYGKELMESSAVRPTKTIMRARSTAAPQSIYTHESTAPQVPSALRSPGGLNPINPAISDTFNITVAGASTEEDLRDLESKISKILSEQIRRYYGSTKI